ncbi:hypothetical protein K438DRAFT_1844557 [Mycena galopus ATCC 62051]|nr:hypothetical protein K438DRAFT_1844557 [Mycena galopus ATCC 62051]
MLGINTFRSICTQSRPLVVTLMRQVPACAASKTFTSALIVPHARSWLKFPCLKRLALSCPLIPHHYKVQSAAHLRLINLPTHHGALTTPYLRADHCTIPPIHMMPSLPPSPTRSTFEPTTRRSDSASFFMYDSQDSFYHSRKSSADIETGCLVPSDSIDGTMPDLPSPSDPKKTSRRNTYADYRRWFSRNTPHAQAIQLPIAETPKGVVELPPSRIQSKFEERVQTGSWCAMFVLALLTVYFLIRET